MRAAARDQLAFDRAASVRTKDLDGHLHIADSPISKAAVNPYYGAEIPEHEELGLDPARVYYLFRDPQELQKAAPTFNGKPLLSAHKPQFADTHDHALTVGAISNPRWQQPYIRASLVVWDAAAIARIESKAQRELSAGYRYKAVMQPGWYGPDRYDGRMTDIVGNHVTLVTTGRAGADVVVGDAALASKFAPRLPPARRHNRAKFA